MAKVGRTLEVGTAAVPKPMPSVGTTVKEDLSDVLREFARTMVTDFPIQGILDHLVKRIVEILPVTGAGVTLISPTLHPRYVAASNASAHAFERLQTELGDGPCLAAYLTGRSRRRPRPRPRRPFPEIRAAGGGDRAGRGVHLSPSPR